MSQHAQESFAVTSLIRSGPEGRSKLALVLGEGTLDVRPPTIKTRWEMTVHLTAVPTLGESAGPAVIDGDDGRPNTQELATDGVKRLAVVGRVRQDPVQGQMTHRLGHHGEEAGGIVAGTSRDQSPRPKMSLGMTRHRQFGPESLFETTGMGSMVDVVETGLADVESRRVDRGFRTIRDQTPVSSAVEYSSEQPLESPFFKSRLSAFWRVVQ